ncbi:hypothetical protein ETR_08491 [Erwinia tracheiphila PSU-1]|nr:hypothetical protein ETR_08491 [Erwinia tracheiphila PSU-1]
MQGVEADKGSASCGNFFSSATVIRDKYHLQLTADDRIVINFLRNFVNGVDDIFGEVIAGHSFGTKQEYARHYIRLRIFMQTFNLHVKQGIRINLDAGQVINVVRQVHFVIVFNLAETLAEVFIVCR